jgi:carboxyl-terminal processing protease
MPSIFQHLSFQHLSSLPIVRYGGSFLAATAATTALVALTPGFDAPVQAEFRNSPKSLVDEVWQLVNNSYVDGSFNQTDWRATRTRLLSQNYTSKEQAYNAIRAALKQLNDPYTRFMNPAEFTALTTQTSGELSGIGITLGQNAQKALLVIEPIPNSPASRAGIQAGDQLLAIDGRSTANMSVEEASRLIRGKAGTPIRLSIARESRGNFDLNLTRAIIELPTVTSAVHQEGTDRIGYIRLNEFNAHASEQMRAAIKKLTEQKVQGFVLDLRGNPGGLLTAGVDITRMWLDTGMIVRTVDRDGNSEPISANRSALTQLPLAVLVDGNSASCSEIVTGALQDNRRATIVGTQTFGKALVQAIHDLSDGSGLAVTIAHYYTPKGTDINHKGIAPDVQVSLDDGIAQVLARSPNLVGTSRDPQYARAVMSLKNQIQVQRPQLPPGKPQAVLPGQRPAND